MLRSFGYGPFWSRPIMLKQRASPGWGSLKLLQEAGLSKRWRYTADFSLLVVVVNTDFVQTEQLQVEKSQGKLGQAGLMLVALHCKVGGAWGRAGAEVEEGAASESRDGSGSGRAAASQSRWQLVEWQQL